MIFPSFKKAFAYQLWGEGKCGPSKKATPFSMSCSPKGVCSFTIRESPLLTASFRDFFVLKLG